MTTSPTYTSNAAVLLSSRRLVAHKHPSSGVRVSQVAVEAPMSVSGITRGTSDTPAEHALARGTGPADGR